MVERQLRLDPMLAEKSVRKTTALPGRKLGDVPLTLVSTIDLHSLVKMRLPVRASRVAGLERVGSSGYLATWFGISSVEDTQSADEKSKENSGAYPRGIRG